MNPTPVLRQLSPAEAGLIADQLGALLIDAIAGGASVTFLPGLTPTRATAYWRDVARTAASDGRATGGRAIITALDHDGLCGFVQVIPTGFENQLHRAEIAKLMVHSRARRRGLGASLLNAAEAAARTMNKTLLTLDTAKGDDAERLYARLDWQRAGEIPDFALAPSGELATTVLFWKRLG